MTKLYERFMSRFGKYLEGANGTQRAIRRMLGDLERTERKYKENKKAKIMLAHELNNHLTALTTFPDLLKADETEEGRIYMLNILSTKGKILTDLVGILSLDGMSRRELDKNAEIIILRELTKDHAFSLNKDLEDEKIGLHLKYNNLTKSNPIGIYANKAAFSAAWGTLSVNAFERAPPFSTITQAFRVNNKDNLEAIMENEFSEKVLRKRGFGRGIGTPFVKDFVEKMCGNFETYRDFTQIQKDYEIGVDFGYKKARLPEENTQIYGAKIKIPMDQLANPIKRSKETQ